MDMSLLPKFVAVDWNGTVVPAFHYPPYHGAVETLAGWRAQGAVVIVVSAATQSLIEAEVQRVGISADEIIGCQEKSSIFSELRSRYGHGVVVGDQPADLRAAQDAGLPFIQACLEGQNLLQGSEAGFAQWVEAHILVDAC